jgi:hypothetical protein
MRTKLYMYINVLLLSLGRYIYCRGSSSP